LVRSCERTNMLNLFRMISRPFLGKPATLSKYGMIGMKNAVAFDGSCVVNGPLVNQRTSSFSTSYPLLNVGIQDIKAYRARASGDNPRLNTLKLDSNAAASSHNSLKFLNRPLFTGNSLSYSASSTARSHRIVNVSYPYSSIFFASLLQLLRNWKPTLFAACANAAVCHSNPDLACAMFFFDGVHPVPVPRLIHATCAMSVNTTNAHDIPEANISLPPRADVVVVVFFTTGDDNDGGDLIRRAIHDDDDDDDDDDPRIVVGPRPKPPRARLCVHAVGRPPTPAHL